MDSKSNKDTHLAVVQTEYNTKVIEHPNGSVQIIRYDHTIRSHKEIMVKNSSDDDISNNEISNKRISKKKYNNQLHKEQIEHNVNILTEVFGCKITCISQKRASETSLERAYREEHNLLASLKHTKKKINELARSTVWEYFVTLTFSPEKIDRTDYKLCMLKVRVWLNNQRKLAPDLKYLCVPEMHKKQVDGKPTWHCHILMADIGNIKLKDSGLVAVGKKSYKRDAQYKNNPTIYNLSGWKYGFSTAIPIKDDNGKICQYMTKYITKDLIQMSAKAHKYYASQNLTKPKVKTYNVPNHIFENFQNDYLNENGLEITYGKSVSGYNPTDYYELHKKGGA